MRRERGDGLAALGPGVFLAGWVGGGNESQSLWCGSCLWWQWC
jgi:hypothetical protein